MTSIFNIAFSKTAETDFEKNTTDVDIWLLDINQLGEENILSASKCLSTEEKERGKRFRKHIEFIATRTFVRLCLERYAKIPATKLEFEKEAQGKPYLSKLKFPLHFNLSHSDNIVALAINNHAPVGVDVEGARTRSFMDIAENYFHPDEYAQLQACEADEQKQLFFKFWTLKEAVFKALGTGIVTGLEKVLFDLSGEAIEFSFAPDLHLTESDWQLYQASPAEGVNIALARKANAPLTLNWFDGANLF